MIITSLLFQIIVCLYAAHNSKSGEFAKIDASDLKPSKQAIFGDNMADAEGFKDEDVNEGKNPLFESRAVYTSQSEFRQGHVIEGLSNLAMGGVRGCQTHSCIQLLKFQHELEKAINKATKEHYVGKLEKEWQFPSDHVPVGIKLGKNRIISWNVLNEHFIDWVYKNSQGLKGSMITDLDKPSTKYPSITLREELIIQYILQIIASNKNIILSLQECRPEFISALTKAMPPNMGFVLSDFSLLRKDQEITLYNKDVFTFIESESSIVHAFESDKKRTLMDLTFVEKESGTRLQIINTHIPGNPAGPGPNEFAQYVLTYSKKNCILVALGDMNFNEETMKKTFEVEGQKLGSHLSLENFVDYNTDIEPYTFIAKDIDLIFVSKNHSLPCQSMKPDEILQGLQSTVDLLFAVKQQTSLFCQFCFYNKDSYDNLKLKLREYGPCCISHR